MINDRVNCMRYVFTSKRYIRSTNWLRFLYIAQVSFRKSFYLLRHGGGQCKGVAVCVEKIKILKFDVISANFSIFVA